VPSGPGSEGCVQNTRLKGAVALVGQAVPLPEVEEARPLETTYQLTNIDPQQVELFVRQRSIDKTVEDALRKVLARKAAIAELDSQKEGRDGEMAKIFDDQQRLRENMKALKAAPRKRRCCNATPSN